MKIFRVIFSTNWGEKHVWGLATSFDKAAELAMNVLTKNGWPFPVVISVAHEANTDFKEELE